MKQVGVHALVSIITYLVTIGISFRVVKSLRVEKFFRKGHTSEIQIFLLFVAIGLGYLVAQFLLALIDQSMILKLLF